MTPDEYTKLQEISRLLNEAYKHYFSYEGHCKSSEGHIEVSYGNYWERSENPSDLKITSVSIYSYVLCTDGREAYFDSVDEALETVKEWHANEMAYDPNTPEEEEMREYFDQMSAEFLNNMMEQGKLTIHAVSFDTEEEQDN